MLFNVTFKNGLCFITKGNFLREKISKPALNSLFKDEGTEERNLREGAKTIYFRGSGKIFE
jgi:hypothetical protein